VAALRSLVIVLAILAVGCDAFAETPRVVNGWSVGERVSCEAMAHCEQLGRLAFEELDRIDPDHAHVVDWAMHREGWYADPTQPGKKLLPTRSGGCCHVFVAELADGTAVAFGVGFPGVSTAPIAQYEGPALTMFGAP
jgi:hypothetical protein